jgi:DNA-directed RNA polymerase specialized sigma24 family protein
MAEHDEQRDAALVAAVGRGDADAFDEIYVRYLPLVVRWSLRATGNREVAADLTAEVFAASLTAARRFRPERGSVAGWLLGIGRNKLRESRRRGRVENSSRRLVEGLPETLRGALTERVLHERPYQEIASELRCSESVVRQRVSRALKALRSQLEET